eukprot:scaffold2438_cov167-Amphora_coffeaeformis.AAC.20
MPTSIDSSGCNRSTKEAKMSVSPQKVNYGADDDSRSFAMDANNEDTRKDCSLAFDVPNPPFPLGTKIFQIVELPEVPKNAHSKTYLAVMSGVLTKYEKVRGVLEPMFRVEFEDGEMCHYWTSDVEKLLSEAGDIHQRLAVLRQPLGEPPYELGTTIPRIIDDNGTRALIEGVVTFYGIVVTGLGADLCFTVEYDYQWVSDEFLTTDDIKDRLKLYVNRGIEEEDIEISEANKVAAEEFGNDKEDSEAEVEDDSVDNNDDGNDNDEDYEESENDSSGGDDDEYYAKAVSFSKKHKRW